MVGITISSFFSEKSLFFDLYQSVTVETAADLKKALVVWEHSHIQW
jgi:hypothetical protein